jgi:glycosyltransferase involved in cell wall biosynthesis
MKKLMLICAPFTSRSGYGDHARDLFHAFDKTDQFDIKLWDVRWGDCPRNALNLENEKDKRISDCILKNPKTDKQPDVYVDIRIPNEFQTIGKFNIGITAGVETNAVSQLWIEGCNKMDLIIVPSEHSKRGFVNTVFDKIENLPNGQRQKVAEIKLLKPMEVLFEGFDEDIYKPTKDIPTELNDLLNTIEEDFCFLFVGQWVKGNYGEDRKDIGRMIKVFLETFSNRKEQPTLVLKTSGATFSIMDREEILKKIKEVKAMFPKDWNLPKIQLLHGELSDEEMNGLYNHPKIKAMVSFTHGEGFGRPLLEATAAKLPVIAPNWSGQADFLNPNYSQLLPGELKPVPASAVWKDIVIPESQWFNVDENQAFKFFKNTFENYKEVKNRAGKQYEENKKFTLDKMCDGMKDLCDKYLKDLPTQVGLNLPKLKKVSDAPPAIKLPKLKKVSEGAVKQEVGV